MSEDVYATVFLGGRSSVASQPQVIDEDAVDHLGQCQPVGWYWGDNGPDEDGSIIRRFEVD